jgi:hypothetical protein
VQTEENISLSILRVVRSSAGAVRACRQLPTTGAAGSATFFGDFGRTRQSDCLVSASPCLVRRDSGGMEFDTILEMYMRTTRTGLIIDGSINAIYRIHRSSLIRYQ